MNKAAILFFLLTLVGCSVNRQADVSDVDTTSGIVRLTYGQAMLQSATTDPYIAQGTATRQCQQAGYATAVAYGQPITTCTVTSGSLCLNEKVTLQYQCRGVAVSQNSVVSYW